MQWLDYVIFVAFLLVSVGIGVYHACTGNKQRTTREFLLADRKLKMIPTMLSLLVTLQSAIMVLGHAAEMVTRGVQAWLWECIAYTIAILTAERFIVPWMYRQRVASVYQFLEMRFASRALRIFGAFLGLVSAVLYMGIAMYAPAIALETATGFPTSASVPIMAVVTVIYTALGGMRAVIWVDVFQSAVIFGGLLAILIRGCVMVGGFQKALNIAEEEGRLIWVDTSPDPTVRHTAWGFLGGYSSAWIFAYGLMQTTVQRYSAVSTLRGARLAFLLNIPLLVLMVSIVCMIGIVVLAYYAQLGCDPLASQQITHANQILPLFVRDVFADTKGFYGLFLATLYSGALSSVSSSLSGAAANTWEDILRWKLPNLSESKAAALNKGLVVMYGGLAIGIAYLASSLSGPISQIGIMILGSTGGPIFGIYLLGAFRSLRWVEWKGALTGGVFGFALTLWIGLGSVFVSGIHPPLPPTSTERCEPSFNTTVMSFPPVSGLSKLYSVSYVWYMPIGCGLTFILGLLVSWVTVTISGQKQVDVSDNVFLRWRDALKISDNTSDGETNIFRGEVKDESVLMPIKSAKQDRNDNSDFNGERRHLANVDTRI